MSKRPSQQTERPFMRDLLCLENIPNDSVWQVSPFRFLNRRLSLSFKKCFKESPMPRKSFEVCFFSNRFSQLPYIFPTGPLKFFLSIRHLKSLLCLKDLSLRSFCHNSLSLVFSKNFQIIFRFLSQLEIEKHLFQKYS